MKLIFLFLLVFGFLTCISQDSTKTIETSEQLFNSTIKIQGFKDTVINGKTTKKPITTGTGFFFSYVIGKDTIPVIVSNKHTIISCKTGVLKFNSTNQKGQPSYGDILTITLDNFDKLWLSHPSEDLAILPLGPIRMKLLSLNKKLPYSINFVEELIPSKNQENEISAIEDVLMVGYPKGFSDTVNNVPIIRKGMTATPFFLNYNNQKRFLLDIPIYPGSSGSPIIIYTQSGYSDKKGTFIVGKPRLYLIGIAVESQNYIAMGETVTNEPKKKIKTKTPLPFEIAIAIKSSVLLDFKLVLEKALHDKAYNDRFRLIIK